MWKKRKLLLVGLIVILWCGVVALIVMGKIGEPDNNDAAVQRVRELAAEAVARYEAQFAQAANDAAPPGSTLATELFDQLLPSLVQATEEEAYDNLLTLQEKKHWSEWTVYEIDTLVAFLREHACLVADIRALADLREPVYHVDLSKGLETELPHLAPLRTMVRLLRFEAAVRAHSGDLEGAMANYHAIFKLGETLVEEPFTISQLVREALNRIAFEGMGSALPSGKLSPEQARSFVRQTEGLYHREGLAGGLANEAELMLKRIRRDPLASEDPVLFPDSPAHTVALLFLYRTGLGDNIVSADRRTCARFMERVIHAARKPYYEAEIELEAIEAEIDNLSFVSMYTRMLVPEITRIQVVQARNEALLDLMRIGLLLETQYAETGSYPASLGNVAHDLGGSVPVDPFTGRSFVYLPEGDSLTLYSVGQNQQEDGGRHDYRDGDIVWRGIEERQEDATDGDKE